MTTSPGPQDRLGDDRDLPGARAGMPVIGEHGIEPAGPAGQSPTPAAGTAARSGDGPTTQNIVSVFGDTRRAGRWRPAAKVTSFSLFGDTVLDLREAEFDGDELTIEGTTLFGDVKVIVPPGTAVELGGFTLFGDQRHDHRPGTPPAGFPRVRVTGRLLFGDVKVFCLDVGEEPPSFWKRITGQG